MCRWSIGNCRRPSSIKHGVGRRFTQHKRDNPQLGGGMIFKQSDGTFCGTNRSGVPGIVSLDSIESQIGNNVSLYAHSITRSSPQGGGKGGKAFRVVVAPATTPVVWLPVAMAQNLSVRTSWGSSSLQGRNWKPIFGRPAASFVQYSWWSLVLLWPHRFQGPRPGAKSPRVQGKELLGTSSLPRRLVCIFSPLTRSM